MKKILFILASLISFSVFAVDLNFETPKNLTVLKHSHNCFDSYYVPDWKEPLIVTYTLTADEAVRSEAAKMKRPTFYPCGKVGSVKQEAYSNTGYDRGHLCPNNDRDYNYSLQKETFSTCNIVPQTHAMNAGEWRSLEEKGHELAKKLGHIDILSGVIFSGDKRLKSGVRIPSACFKIFYNKDSNFIECYIVTQDNLILLSTLNEISNETGIVFR